MIVTCSLGSGRSMGNMSTHISSLPCGVDQSEVSIVT